jgi:hypothetical protein
VELILLPEWASVWGCVGAGGTAEGLGLHDAPLAHFQPQAPLSCLAWRQGTGGLEQHTGSRATVVSPSCVWGQCPADLPLQSTGYGGCGRGLLGHSEPSRTLVGSCSTATVDSILRMESSAGSIGDTPQTSLSRRCSGRGISGELCQHLAAPPLREPRAMVQDQR